MANSLLNNKKIIIYLKKNKDFFIQNPQLLNILKFPSAWNSEDKIVDFNLHQSKKLKNDNKILKSKISQILKIGMHNISANNIIFETILKILNTNSLDQFFKILLDECSKLLNWDYINILSNNTIKLKNEIKYISDVKIKKLFKRNERVNILNDEIENKIFFPKNYKVIKSYMLLKVSLLKKGVLIFCIGSKEKNTFTKNHSTDLIIFFTKICEIKINSLYKKNNN